MSLCAALTATDDGVRLAMSPSFNPISVVIRTKNSAATLDDVIAGLGLTGDDELIVVDSGSRDATLEIARRAGARIVDFSREPFSYGKSLNVGFAAARNDWVLALSSHCIPAAPDLLGRYRRQLDGLAPEIAGITGTAVVSRTRDLKADAPPEICRPADFARGVYFTGINPNCLYRRAVWAGRPFAEQIATAEDLEWWLWAFRHGYSLMRDFGAVVLYRSRLGFFGMVKKGYRETRVGMSLVPNPPFTLLDLTRTVFWSVAAAVRFQIPPGQALGRIGYSTGIYWARRGIGKGGGGGS